jgi:hypothetical protein
MVLLPEDKALAALSGTKKTLGRGCRGPGCMLCRVMGWSYGGQAGGEILLDHYYRDGRED